MAESRRLQVIAGGRSPRRVWRLTLRVVAERWGVPSAELLGTGRAGGLTRARELLCWLAREHGGLTLAELGRLMSRSEPTMCRLSTQAERRIGAGGAYSDLAADLEAELRVALRRGAA